MWNKILPWAIVACLCALLILLLVRDSRVAPTIIETQRTDTLYKTRVDTFFVEKPVVKTEKVVEEKIIYVHDTVKVVIPISEYRFFQDGIYDITARGYDVSLSNVTVFPKTEYRTVTNTVETTVYKDTWNLYFGAGIWALNDQVVPTVNLSLKTPKMWLISLNTGYYNGDIVYGGQISYKILGK
jgi:hypothetical protein